MTIYGETVPPMNPEFFSLEGAVLLEALKDTTPLIRQLSVAAILSLLAREENQ